VTVEDDLLHVHLDPAHAHAVRKTEVLAFHGVPLDFLEQQISMTCGSGALAPMVI
jgi:hypothetical protein